MPRTSDSGEVAVEDVRPPAVALGLRSVRSLRARLRPLAARVRPLVPLVRVLGFAGALAIVAYMGFRAARGGERRLNGPSSATRGEARRTSRPATAPGAARGGDMVAAAGAGLGAAA